jgi:integrase
MKLTASSVRSLRLPTGKSDHIVWDDDCPGFGVRLREAGSVNYVYQYAIGKKQRRMTLGAVSAVPIGNARKTAEELYARTKLGEDPQADKASAKIQAEETFAAVAKRFLEFQRGRLRPRSYPNAERHLLQYSKALHELQIDKITRRDIATVIATVAKATSGPTSNRARSTLSSMFGWAIREGLLEANPVLNTNKADEHPRERTLSPEELRLIWTCADEDSQYTPIIRLLMLTGARLNEIAALRWLEIQGEWIVLPSTRVKNKKAHEIFITAPMRAIIEALPQQTNPDGSPRSLIFGSGSGPFSGWSKAKAALDARIAEANGKPLEHWTPHDLRRSFSTHCNEFGLALPHAIEACLGHVGFRAGVAKVYNLAQYRNETRACWERWANQLLAWVEERESNVVTLRQA